MSDHERLEVHFKGVAAYNAGTGRDSNPYDPSDWRREVWAEGWIEAWAMDDDEGDEGFGGPMGWEDDD